MNDNPYASPADDEESASSIAAFPAQPYPRRCAKALLRWTVLCGISAGPSFAWAYLLFKAPQDLAAIVAGIAVFIVGYAIIECSDWFARFQQLPSMKTALRIGYGTRVGLSIVFPLGMWLDMIVGMISTALTDTLTQEGLGVMHDSHSSAGPALSAAHTCCVFLNTLLQGALLNVLLFAYMAIVYGICRMTAPRPSRRAKAHVSPNFS